MNNSEKFREISLYVAESFSKKNSQAAYLNQKDGLWADELQTELNELANTNNSEKQYLDAIMEHMLTPYYQQLGKAEQKIRDRVEQKLSKEIGDKLSPLEVIMRLARKKVSDKFEAEMKAADSLPKKEDRLKAQGIVLKKILEEERKITGKDEYSCQASGEYLPKHREEVEKQLKELEGEIQLEIKKERARINHNLRETKISINRGLQAYNDNNKQGGWFLSRIVALQHPVSSIVPPKLENREAFVAAFKELVEESSTIKRDKLEALLKRHMPLHFQFYNNTRKYLLKDIVKHAAYGSVYQSLDADLKAFVGERIKVSPKTETEYRKYFSHLTEQWQKDLLEKEWDRVTRNRISFRERLKEAQKKEVYKNKHQLMLDILAGMYTDKGSEHCNKSYVSVEYSADVLKKVKNNIKRRNKIARALVTVGTVIVAGSEGGAVGVATNSLEIGVAGFLANAPTMHIDSQGPIKNLMNGRILGEKGEAFDKSKRAQAAIFSVSAFGFSAGLALIAIGSISAICPLVGIAVAIASLSLFLVYAMFQKYASDAAREGEGAFKELFLNLYNFKKIWADLKDKVSDKTKRLVIFIFRDIIGKLFITIFKVIAVAAAILSFLTCSKNFIASKLINGPAWAGKLLGICGSILAAPTNILFVQMKVRSLKNIFVKWIKSLVGNSNNVHVLRKMARLLTHFSKGLLKLIISVGVFAAAALVSIFSVSLWLGKKLGLAIKHARHMQRHKRNVMLEKIKNHKIHANFRKNLNGALASVSNTTLGVCALANGAGQGALYAQPMLSLFQNNMMLNWIGAAITFLMQGICSFVLNADGASSATEQILGDGMQEAQEEKPSAAATSCTSQWKELASTVLKQFFSLWVLLAQHFFGAKDKARVSKRYDSFTSLLANNSQADAVATAPAAA